MISYRSNSAADRFCEKVACRSNWQEASPFGYTTSQPISTRLSILHSQDRPITSSQVYFDLMQLYICWPLAVSIPTAEAYNYPQKDVRLPPQPFSLITHSRYKPNTMAMFRSSLDNSHPQSRYAIMAAITDPKRPRVHRALRVKLDVDD